MLTEDRDININIEGGTGVRCGGCGCLVLILFIAFVLSLAFVAPFQELVFGFVDALKLVLTNGRS